MSVGDVKDCDHADVARVRNPQAQPVWMCTDCTEEFLPKALIEDIQADFEMRASIYNEAAASLLVRTVKILADEGHPVEQVTDDKMYAPEECPGHEGNPCQHCGTSVFLGGTDG
jgi:hypothetical protein